MNPPPMKASRNAANWMLGLGILYGAIAVLLSGCAVRFGHSEFFVRLFPLMFGGEILPTTRETKGGPFDDLVALLFGSGALVLMLLTVAFLVTQRFVRRGSRRARKCGAVFCGLVAAATLPPVLFIIGTSPNWNEIAQIGLVVALWILPDVWLIFLLFKARADTANHPPRAL